MRWHEAVAFFLTDLGTSKTYSPPHVSEDNTYSKAIWPDKSQHANRFVHGTFIPRLVRSTEAMARSTSLRGLTLMACFFGSTAPVLTTS